MPESALRPPIPGENGDPHRRDFPGIGGWRAPYGIVEGSSCRTCGEGRRRSSEVSLRAFAGGSECRPCLGRGPGAQLTEGAPDAGDPWVQDATETGV